jgi:hypothetical protein
MAKKGSQLKRFKDSLSSITRPSQGKRKRNVVPNKDVDRNEKLKHIEEQFNSFDTKFTRTKHEVFGRKVKGKVGKPLVSRTIGEENVWSFDTRLNSRENLLLSKKGNDGNAKAV